MVRYGVMIDSEVAVCGGTHICNAALLTQARHTEISVSPAALHMTYECESNA